MKPEYNYAFIDGNNLRLAISGLGWTLDYYKFRVYLRDKYKVKIAYLFIGYMQEHQDLYASLQKDGFVLIFKPTLKDKNGKVKGNCDAELVLQAMIDLEKYDKALIVTGDGDFGCLVKYLYDQSKLSLVLAPDRFKHSVLLRQTAKERIEYMNSLRGKLEYKKRHRS